MENLSQNTSAYTPTFSANDSIDHDRTGLSFLPKLDQPINLSEWLAPQHPANVGYSKLLLEDTSSTRLIAKFLREPYSLKVSDAGKTDFSLAASLSRLEQGYSLISFDYLTAAVSEAFIQLHEADLLIQFNRSESIQVPLSSLSGLVLGSATSTFQFYLKKRGNLATLGLSSFDCFSVVAHDRLYDFATLSELIKYDVFTALSWKIAEQSRTSRIVPLTKQQLLCRMVKAKIEAMAAEKHLTVKELWLLAIVKSLILKKSSLESTVPATSALDKAFSGGMKLYRVCFKLRPFNFRPTLCFLERDKERDRLRYLATRRLLRLRGLPQSHRGGEFRNRFKPNWVKLVAAKQFALVTKP